MIYGRFEIIFQKMIISHNFSSFSFFSSNTWVTITSPSCMHRCPRNSLYVCISFFHCAPNLHAFPLSELSLDPFECDKASSYFLSVDSSHLLLRYLQATLHALCPSNASGESSTQAAEIVTQDAPFAPRWTHEAHMLHGDRLQKAFAVLIKVLLPFHYTPLNRCLYSHFTIFFPPVRFLNALYDTSLSIGWLGAYVGRVGRVGGRGIGSARTPCQNVFCILARTPCQNRFLFPGPPVKININ